MSPKQPEKKARSIEIPEVFIAMLEHFSHVLPAQAPIRDFVHHNTLHGFEHLTFPEALKASNQLTGAYGYWSQQKFQEQYAQGRINDEGIALALAKDRSLDSEKEMFKLGERTFYRRDLYHTLLLYPIKNITICQLKWQQDEVHAFTQFQANIPDDAQQTLLKQARTQGLNTEADAITQLWAQCLKQLGLEQRQLHPEDLMDLTTFQAKKMFDTLSPTLYPKEDKTLDEAAKKEQQVRQKAWATLENLLHENPQLEQQFSLKFLIKTLTGVTVQDNISQQSQSKIEPLVYQTARDTFDHLLNQIGKNITLSTFLKQITGIDLQKEMSSYLQPYFASWMDHGFAAWNAAGQEGGFYQSWKKSALVDQNCLFNNLTDWKDHISSLPNDPIKTIITEFERMGIAPENWAGYLEQLALDLPGWSGMFYWRHSNPNYEGYPTDMNMMDYLAVRLVTEHIYLRCLCREHWLIDANLAVLRGYFHDQSAEFFVRYMVNNQHLPEYIICLSQPLIERHSSGHNAEDEWHYLSDLIWTWQQAPTADTEQNYLSHHEGWKLFLIAQHFGLSGTDIKQLSTDNLTEIFTCIERLDHETSGFLLLQAYEHHYREQIFNVITENQGRGTWKDRQQRPEAQIIFCMDDREESLRRHLEHLNPNIETLGAAAFFGVVMDWKGLNDQHFANLCPVVVKPEHDIKEVIAAGQEQQLETHQKRYQQRTALSDLIHQESHRSLFSGLVIAASAPLAALRLTGKIFAPVAWKKFEKTLQKNFDTEVTTRITSTAEDVLEARSIHNKQQGFTLGEQTNIVESFLQNNGLLSGFAHFVVLAGHYSRNENNPHAAAYGCGACGGKYSGPNGRAFAAMANHPEVRKSLSQRGIEIPEDCWFLGAEHDTCNEHIEWFDTDLVPQPLRPQLEKLQKELGQATQHSAHERCRKLASAPRQPSLSSALKHMIGRGADFSQARPELGHATIGCGFIGRRYLSQGTFLDRRSFLISYDANIDPEGTFLERILLTAGPVGAGINLEYYFSAVNNDKYGSSSKIVHNLSGLFGVMEGGSGDLRTGLPQQMIEIHEPMRLQLMVEADTEILTQIYQRQPSIQQLVGNGWLLLSAKDPQSEAIHTFDPEQGWQRWKNPEITPPMVDRSADWYQGHTHHLPPALIKKRGLSNA